MNGMALQACKQGDTPRRLLYDCVDHYLVLRAAERSEYEALLEQQSNRPVKEAKMTWSENVEARGEARGIRESLLLILQARFGTLPETLLRRIDAMSSVDELRQWVSRAALASSTRELEQMP